MKPTPQNGLPARHPATPRRLRKRASALITTLLVVVVLSIIVVAFMQSMSIERRIANSVANRLQAELMADAAVQSAIEQILVAVDTNGAFVTGTTNFSSAYGPVTTIGRSDLTNATQIMPLVSLNPSNLTTFGQAAWTNTLASVFSSLMGTNSADLNGRSKTIQNSSDTRLFRGAWVVVRDSAGNPVGRYSFHVLDEQARVNPAIHNGTGSMTNATNWYSGPRDISLTNSAAQILPPAVAANVASMSSKMLTHESIGQAFSNRLEFENVKHLLTSQANLTFDVIPARLPGAGLPKLNINDAVTNTSAHWPGSTNAAESLGQYIGTNLTSFGSRDPSLRGSANEQRYINRLAANIFDYIDTNQETTLINGGEPAGRDLSPFVTAIAEQFRLVSETSGPPLWTATIETRIFAQLWNPYTVPITGTVKVRLLNRVRLNYGTGITQWLDPFDPAASIAVTVRPNEFVVVEFPNDSKTISSPTAPAGVSWANTPADSQDQTTHPHFEMEWNGVLTDMNRRSPIGPGTATAGLPKNSKTLTLNAYHYQVNAVPTQSGTVPPFRFVGDPRATFLSNYDWGSPISSDATYGANTYWKGRNRDTFPYSQNWLTTWINRDFVPRNPTLGNTPGNVNTTPAQVLSAYVAGTDGPAAMAYLRNGAMVSIGELGHVFDPIQAADDLTAPNGGTPASIYVAGGGRTLRIGQIDYSTTNSATWNTNGRRAAELLDIFSVNSTNASSFGCPAAIGRINPNTASVDVLSAMLSGIRVASDEGIAGANLVNVGLIASNIVTNRPYSSLSDLYKMVSSFSVGTNYSPSFSSSVGGGTTNLSAFDRVREEAFGKIVQHFAVQSRTYRVVAIGEALDARAKPNGRVAVEAIIYFDGAPGAVLNPIVKYWRYLP